MFLIIIILLLLGLYNQELFLDIFQYNYLETENNNNCKYHYPEYQEVYSPITGFLEDRINECNQFKGFK